MARQTAKIVIGKDTYELTQLGATEGLAIYSKLLRVLGPMIRKTFADPAVTEAAAKRTLPRPDDAEAPAIFDEAKPLEVTTDAGMRIASIVIEGIETLDTTMLLELADKFASCSKVKLDAGMVDMSAGDIFDQHFAGRYVQLTKWLMAHLKLNFADFLAGSTKSAGQNPAA